MPKNNEARTVLSILGVLMLAFLCPPRVAAQVAASDYAAANAGQLKYMAAQMRKALDHCGGASQEIADLVDGFSQSDNYAAVNLGQLKYVAKPFYEHLGRPLPWTTDTTADDQDYAAANLGQIKRLFLTEPLVGLYVDSFDTILGVPEQEDELFDYVDSAGVNYLAFYDLRTALPVYPESDPDREAKELADFEKLAEFIKRARGRGVTRVGAIGSGLRLNDDTSKSDFGRIHEYNVARNDEKEKFDVYNVEFEFWNGDHSFFKNENCDSDTLKSPTGVGEYECSRTGAFDYLQHVIAADLRTKTANTGILTEIYIGWTSQTEAEYIASEFDRILVHSYRSDPNQLYGITEERLGWLDNTPGVIVAPIFSAEEEFSGPDLKKDASGRERTRSELLSSLPSFYRSNYWNEFHTDSEQPGVNLCGYQWFKYTLMKTLTQ